jgi:hypothetical protein
MRKEYLVINDSVSDPNLNGTARAVEFMKAGWVKGESLGTEHLRVYEMKLYEPGERTVEEVNLIAEEAYVKLCKEWLEGRGSITHEILANFDTADSLRAAAEEGRKTSQQEFAEKGYIVIDQAVTKGVLMAKYSKGEPPTLPPNVMEYVKRRIQEQAEAEERVREADAQFKAEQEAEQNRLKGEAEAQEEAEARVREGIAREEEAEQK